MQQIISFVVQVVGLIVQTCQSNFVLQWTLYTFVFFSILFAFKVIFTWQAGNYHEKETSGKEPSFRFSNFSQKLLTTGKRRKSN